MSGTAGSGKSTALMKLALRLVAQGNSVSWVSPEGDFSPRDIRTSAAGLKQPHVNPATLAEIRLPRVPSDGVGGWLWSPTAVYSVNF